MNNNLPETPLGKRLLDKSARRIPAPSGLWERVEQKRSKKTFSRHLFALVLATSIAGTGFALLRPRTAAWHLRNRAVTVGETLVSAQSPLTLAAAGIGALQLEPQLSLSEKKS